MVCPPKGGKVDLDNQPLTMTSSQLSSADAFAHKTVRYPSTVGEAYRLASRCKPKGLADDGCHRDGRDHPGGEGRASARIVAISSPVTARERSVISVGRFGLSGASSRCTGCWTLRSGKTLVGSARNTRHATCLSCVKLPSPCSASIPPTPKAVSGNAEIALPENPSTGRYLSAFEHVPSPSAGRRKRYLCRRLP